MVKQYSILREMAMDGKTIFNLQYSIYKSLIPIHNTLYPILNTLFKLFNIFDHRLNLSLIKLSIKTHHRILSVFYNGYFFIMC